MRKIIVSVFFVLIFLCSSAMSVTSEEWINKLNSLWDGKKYTDPKKAMECLDNIIKLNPKEAVPYYNRGIVYSQLRQPQKALENYNQAIRLKPALTQAYINRAVLYLNRGDKKHGCPDAQKACKQGQCQLLDMAKMKKICR